MEGKLAILSFLGLLAVCVCATDPAHDPGSKGSCGNRNPLVLVPGIAGSRIEGKLNISHSVPVPHSFCKRSSNDEWEPMWLNLLPEFIDCYLFYLTMEYDDATGQFLERDGVSMRAVDWGGVSGFDTLDPTFPWSLETRYFHGLLKSLVNLGFEVGKNMFGVPYDWRHVPTREWMDGTKAMIENASKLSDGIPVDVISHSMGCNHFYVFLRQQTAEWKKAYIRNWVAVSAPWVGAGVDVRTVVSGNTLGIATTTCAAVKSMERTFDSIFYLLPQPKFWNYTEPMVVTPTKQFTVNDYAELFEATKTPYGKKVTEEVFELYGNYEHPGVQVSYLYTYGTKTEVKFTYSMESDFEKPQIEYEDGDGTVNMRSLLYVPDKWNSEGHSTFVKGFDKCIHMDSISDSRIVSVIESIICSTYYEGGYDVGS